MTDKKSRQGVGARLPYEVYLELVRVKESTGKSESELINEAIASYLGIAAEVAVPDRLSHVEERLGSLEEQVGTILGKFQRLATR